MREIYRILTIVGWSWAALVGVAMSIWWLRDRRKQAIAFEVIERNEDQR